MFLCGVHFPESQFMAIGNKHRIVAKSLRPTRRPNEMSFDFPFEELDVPHRICKAKQTYEGRAALARSGCALRLKLIFNTLHCARKVTGLPCPSRRIYARRAIESIYRKARNHPTARSGSSQTP